MANAGTKAKTFLKILQQGIDYSSILRDSEKLALYSTDIYRAGDLPIAVIRPQNVEELQFVVRAANANKIAVFTRGGGMSYTDAFIPNTSESIIIDTGALDRIVEINEIDMFVTVEPGLTWDKLNQALQPLGLRTPFWGPFSGIAATVGGSISQNTVSHGSAQYGISAETVVAMDILIANGEILQTGSAAHALNASPFSRFSGPDLAGIFTGDCGVFGIKTQITLRLIRLRPASQCLSFSFQTFAGMNAAMGEVAREGLADENFGLDPALQEGQIARQDSSTKIKTAWQVFRQAKNSFDGFSKLAKMARGGTAFLKRGAFTVHYIVEGVDMDEVKAKSSKLSDICMASGVVVPNSVPIIVQAMPFAPLFNILGPQGQRWVPVHGVLPFSRVAGFHGDWLALLAAYEAEMQELGITSGGMYTTISTNAFLYEIALYWPGERLIIHDHILPDDYKETLMSYDHDQAVSDCVERLKSDLISLFQKHGAAHYQIGKVYTYKSRLSPVTADVVSKLKALLDPNAIMNPGALEL